MATRAGDGSVTESGREIVRAFLPAPLPPIPPIDFTGLQIRLEEASGAL